jgi:hypothetical protein
MKPTASMTSPRTTIAPPAKALLQIVWVVSIAPTITHGATSVHAPVTGTTKGTAA